MTDGADDSRTLFASSVGEQLAAERARQKLELSEVAARTRIPVRHLESIEKGRHADLPAMPYAAGFVKSYAGLLGLDGAALSRTFREEMGEARRAHFEPEAYEPVDPSRVPSRLLAMVALGVALLLGMGYLLLRFETDNSDLARLAADTVTDPRPLPPRLPPKPPVAAPIVPTGPISVLAVEDIWIKVTNGVGGKTLFKDVLKAGQSFVVPEDAADPVLRILKPQLIKVLIGTTELPPVGEPDQLVPAYSLKRDALVARATAPVPPPGTSSQPAMAGELASPSADLVAPPVNEYRPPVRRRHRTPSVQDVPASQPATTEPVADSAEPPRP